jgi:DNA-binding XRE family transcriptional regulator
MRRTKASRTHRVPNRELIERRINEGLSTVDLAARVGVSAKTIRMAEAGFTPGPRIQFEIARVFGCRPLDLWPMERQKVAALS